MSIKKAAYIATAVIGLNEDVAFTMAMDAGCSVRYIVMGGKACGRNSHALNNEVCLFSNKDGIVYRAVVGSKNIYDDLEFLALEEAL